MNASNPRLHCSSRSARAVLKASAALTVLLVSAGVGGCFSTDGVSNEPPCVVQVGERGCAEITSNAYSDYEVCYCMGEDVFEAFSNPEDPAHALIRGSMSVEVVQECKAEVPADEWGAICLPERVRFFYDGPCSEEICPEEGSGDDEVGGRREQGAPPPSYGIGSYAEVIDCGAADCTIERWFVESLVANPIVLLDDPARVRPSVDATGQAGLRVDGVEEGSLAHAMGLVDGDMIKAINDVPLRSPSDVAQAIWRYSDSARFIVKVVDRSGPRRVTWTVE